MKPKICIRYLACTHLDFRIIVQIAKIYLFFFVESDASWDYVGRLVV